MTTLIASTATTSLTGLVVTDPAIAEGLHAEWHDLLGRSDSNYLVLPDPKRYVSRLQASVKSDGARHTITNLSQANPILVNGQVAGNIGSWPQDGVRLVGYWLGKEHWGKGVATRALIEFLHLVTERPLYAHVAKHNAGSIRVLEKCGFCMEREESVEDDGKHVAEIVLVLG